MKIKEGILIIFLVISCLSYGQASSETDVKLDKVEKKKTEGQRTYKIGDKKRIGKDLFFMNQNSPNPFSSYKSINYHLTIKAAEVKVMFYDKDNQLYRIFTIDGSELHGTLILSRDMFEAGKYTYAFVVNGEIITSKVMVVKD